MPVPTDAPKNNEELSTNVSGVEWVEQMAQSLQSPHDTPDGLGSNRRRVISQGQHYSVAFVHVVVGYVFAGTGQENVELEELTDGEGFV